LVIFSLVPKRRGIMGGKGISGTTEFSHHLTGGSGKLRFGRALRGCTSAIVRALQFDPDMRVSNLKDRLMRHRPEHFAKYADALRKAGLPE
jgi:hypothetical protein